MNPSDLKYTRDHEWIKIEGSRSRVGITDYAQRQLGDVVFVELPEVGVNLKQGQPFGTIESVKAVSELYSPMSGQVVEVNGSLKDHPEIVNQDPYAAWILALSLQDTGESQQLLDSAQYDELVK